MNDTRYPSNHVVRTKGVFTMPLKLKEPSKVFTCSLTDFFHQDIDDYRHEAWDIIRRCPQHTFQILTKRPERIVQHLPPDWGDGYPNVWMGTSCGSNKGLSRIFDLIEVPAAIRFVSFEPLWEHIDMNLDISTLLKIDWAIIGGESGNEIGKYLYRPCDLEWIKEIADAIHSVGNAVFIKQMGTYLAKKMKLKAHHGGDIGEWPEEFQIREFPKPRGPHEQSF
jgi:protein gp37